MCVRVCLCAAQHIYAAHTMFGLWACVHVHIWPRSQLEARIFYRICVTHSLLIAPQYLHANAKAPRHTTSLHLCCTNRHKRAYDASHASCRHMHIMHVHTGEPQSAQKRVGKHSHTKQKIVDVKRYLLNCCTQSLWPERSPSVDVSSICASRAQCCNSSSSKGKCDFPPIPYR